MTSTPVTAATAPEPPRTAWPRAAASAVVFRVDHVLLVERGKGAARGLWSLPGGHVEPGETVRAAAQREVLEETSILADLIGLVDVVDVIQHRPDGLLAHHYILTAFYGLWAGGEVEARNDAADARFVRLAELDAYRLTESTMRVIKAAADLLARRLAEA